MTSEQFVAELHEENRLRLERLALRSATGDAADTLTVP